MTPTDLAIILRGQLARRRNREELMLDLAAELDVDPRDLAAGARPVVAPTVDAAMAEFLRVLAAGRADRTVRCYRSGLNRFREWLEYVRVNPEAAPTTAMPPDALERFYVDLLARYGPDKRVTARSYTAAAKAFFRFLFRRRIGPPDTSWEVAKLGVEEVTGRLYYAARRVSPSLYKVAQAALDRPLPPPPDAWPGRNLLRGVDLRLGLLRDRAVLLML